jgi:hypothetical protein
MIGAEMSAFFKISKDIKHASLNSKGTTLASRRVRGLAINEKYLYKPTIKTSMAKKTSNSFHIHRWR